MYLSSILVQAHYYACIPQDIPDLSAITLHKYYNLVGCYYIGHLKQSTLNLIILLKIKLNEL